MKKKLLREFEGNIQIFEVFCQGKKSYSVYKDGVFQSGAISFDTVESLVTRAFIEYKIEKLDVKPRNFNNLYNSNYFYTEKEIGKNFVKIRIMCRGKLIKTISSKRPFSLDSQIDATTDICLFALFILCCDAFKYEAGVIYQHVHEINLLSNSNKRQILEIANEEGLIVPCSWGKKQVKKLINLLTQAKYKKLAECVETLFLEQ